jgi:hypothetical protein
MCGCTALSAVITIAVGCCGVVHTNSTLYVLLMIFWLLLKYELDCQHALLPVQLVGAWCVIHEAANMAITKSC